MKSMRALTRLLICLSIAMAAVVPTHAGPIRVVPDPVESLVTCIGLGGLSSDGDVATHTNAIAGLIPFSKDVPSDPNDGLLVKTQTDTRDVAFMDYQSDSGGIFRYVFAGYIQDNTINCAANSIPCEVYMETLAQWQVETLAYISAGDLGHITVPPSPSVPCPTE